MGNGIIKALIILSTVITLIGLMLAACLKIERVASKTLSYYPRYKIAMEGIDLLDGIPQPMKKGDKIVKTSDSNKDIMATSLCIDDPSWSVMLDFIKSEIAFRKSERNRPREKKSDANENTIHNSNISKINYDRIKAMMVLWVNPARIGSRPLSSPYQAKVFDPSQGKYIGVYDFLSFEEFKLDLKKMLIGELEFFSILFGIIAFLCNMALCFIKWKFKAYLNS